MFNLKKKKTLKKYIIKYVFGFFLFWLLILSILAILIVIIFHVENYNDAINNVSKITRTRDALIQNGVTNNIKNAIISGIHDLFLNLFIYPLSWIVTKIISIIYFIGTGNFTNNLIFNNNGKDNLPVTFWICLYISIGLLIIFIFYRLLIIMMSKYTKQKFLIKNSFKNIVLLLFFAPLVPTIFYVLLQILSLIISLIIQNNKINFSQLIFNSSFTNKIGTMTYIPKSTNDPNFINQNNFSYLICIISLFLMSYILFIVCIRMIMISIELLWLFISTIFVLVTIIGETDNSYKYIKNHNSLVIQRWIIFISIFLSFDIFINSLTIITKIYIDNNKISQSLFTLIAIFSCAFFTLEIPIIVSAIIGNVSNLTDSISHSRRFFGKSKLVPTFFKNRINNSKDIFSGFSKGFVNHYRSQNNINRINKKTLLNSKNNIEKVSSLFGRTIGYTTDLSFYNKGDLFIKDKNIQDKWNKRWNDFKNK